MPIKLKIFFMFPIFAWRNHRAKVIARKIKKWKDESRYSEQWKNDFVLKRARQYAKLLNVKVIVKGRENLPRTVALLTPNHSSFLDSSIMLIALAYPGNDKQEANIQSVYIAKKELKKNRFRGYLDILHTFYIDREKPREAIKVFGEFIDYAKKHKKLAVIFPEGTRTKDGLISTFRSGAFTLAKKYYLPIVPVTINNSWGIGDLTRKGDLTVEVVFDKPIKPVSFINQDAKTLAERVEKIVKRNWKPPVVVPRKNSQERRLA
ncbi:lysophospholipid acyltransferase family protein [Mycoplasma sp. ATU-Cv-508]|uniref:1-acyl-sn-glycerol-3-phosphate acyltransferase n=1 Tax=Mycoplasma sp. ATU-Cv-508 TaxID=2048001 RepID=UPI000FDEE8AB